MAGPITNAGNRKKDKKRKKRIRSSTNEGGNSIEKNQACGQNEAHQISSGDDDCSKGMKKWITEYHQSRSGLKLLQQRSDDFITAHEEKLERERKERELNLQKGDGQLLCIIKEGKRPQMLKVELRWALLRRQPWKMRWPRRSTKNLVISTGFKKEKPREMNS